MSLKQFLSEKFIHLDLKEMNDLPYSQLNAQQKKNIIFGFVISKIFSEGKCCANSSEFEINCGLKRTVLFRALKQLEKEGLIQILNYFEEGKLGETREVKLTEKVKEQLRRLAE
jgi:hypothetical protein